MGIYLKDYAVKCHPDPISNDGALCFFEQQCPNKNKMSSNMGLAADPKMSGFSSRIPT